MLFIKLILFTTIRVSISSFSGPFKSKLAAEFTVVKSISDVISRKSTKSRQSVGYSDL